MTAAALLDLAALAVAVGSLWHAAIRIVSPVAPRGLDRALASITVVAAAAVAQALLLGLVELGTDPRALLAASALCAAAAHVLLPAPVQRPTRELGGWWDDLSRRERVIGGAVAGVGAAWCAGVLLEPSLDVDSALYHLPETVAWIASGTPGSIELITASFPVGNYPVTNEVLLSWVGGLSGNMALILLWAPLSAALLVAAFTLALRTAGSRPGPALLGAVVVLLVPLVGDGATRIGTDLAATSWLAVGAALALRSAAPEHSPNLLPFAVIAFGLAVGTKTSTAPLAVIALGAALYAVRPRRSEPLPTLAAVLVAIAVGGVWSIRNLITHGSPLWPFVSFPGSDPLPPGFDGPDSRFIAQPIATLDGHLGDYLELLGPAILLVPAALLLPLILRDRRLTLAAAALAVSVLAWMNAPFTGATGGFPTDLLAISTLRYLMPSIVLAVAILTLLACRSGRPGRAWVAVLAVAAVIGLVDLTLGRDGVPLLWVLLLGAAVGAAGALAVGPRRGHAGDRRRLLNGATSALALGVVAFAVVALAIYPSRFLGLYADVPAVDDPLIDTRASFGLLAGWFDDQPGYREGDTPVYFSSSIIGPLTGGRLEHPLLLLPEKLGCAEVEARTATAWVVVSIPSPAFGAPPKAAGCLAEAVEAIRLPSGTGGELAVYGGPDPDE